MQNFLMDDIDGFSWLAAWARRSNPPLLSHKRFEAKFLASIVHCTVVERALLAWQGTPRICIHRHEHGIRRVLYCERFVGRRPDHLAILLATMARPDPSPALLVMLGFNN